MDFQLQNGSWGDTWREQVSAWEVCSQADSASGYQHREGRQAFQEEDVSWSQGSGKRKGEMKGRQGRRDTTETTPKGRRLLCVYKRVCFYLHFCGENSKVPVSRKPRKDWGGVTDWRRLRRCDKWRWWGLLDWTLGEEKGHGVEKREISTTSRVWLRGLHQCYSLGLDQRTRGAKVDMWGEDERRGCRTLCTIFAAPGNLKFWNNFFF